MRRTVKVSFKPRPLRPITMPPNIWIRSLSPSMTRVWTRTLSPTLKFPGSGFCCSFSIASMMRFIKSPTPAGGRIFSSGSSEIANRTCNYLVERRFRLLSSRFFLRVFDPRDEIIEEFIVNFSALRVVLHGQSKGMIAQAYLLDNVVGRAPGFDFAPFGETIDCLVVRAIDHFETMRGAALVSQPLDVVILLLRQIVSFGVELERAAEHDV